MLFRLFSCFICLTLLLGAIVHPLHAQPIEEHVAPDTEATDPADDDTLDAPPPPTEAGATIEETSPVPLKLRSVVLRALNKVTARTSDIDVPIGTAVKFGNLEIIARTCWEAPPEERPENAALLDIWEQLPGESAERVYYGWMFSSSPSLASMEHAVYDVTVLHCKARAFKPGEE